MNRHVKLYLLMVAALCLAFVLVVLLWANDTVERGRGDVVDLPTSEPSGIEPCKTEDSPWCWRDDDGVTYVNLAPADPAPATVRLDGTTDRGDR